MTTALSEATRVTLLQRARAAIAAALGSSVGSAGNPPPGPDSQTGAAFRAGAFVTLRLRGELRGCIGCVESDLPLDEVVARCAVSAAVSDPRFPPLRFSECSEVEVEISVLGPIEPVGDVSEVIVGRHGLVCELGRRRGLLLPQVAREWNWNASEFASQTCLKAGLPRDAWRQGARLFKFEAEVFGDSG
jgi:AmmeMemoRadiSam system protein A